MGKSHNIFHYTVDVLCKVIAIISHKILNIKQYLLLY